MTTSTSRSAAPTVCVGSSDEYGSWKTICTVRRSRAPLRRGVKLSSSRSRRCRRSSIAPGRRRLEPDEAAAERRLSRARLADDARRSRCRRHRSKRRRARARRRPLASEDLAQVARLRASGAIFSGRLPGAPGARTSSAAQRSIISSRISSSRMQADEPAGADLAQRRRLAATQTFVDPAAARARSCTLPATSSGAGTEPVDRRAASPAGGRPAARTAAARASTGAAARAPARAPALTSTQRAGVEDVDAVADARRRRAGRG